MNQLSSDESVDRSQAPPTGVWFKEVAAESVHQWVSEEEAHLRQVRPDLLSRQGDARETVFSIELAALTGKSLLRE